MTKLSAKYQHLNVMQRHRIRKVMASAAPEDRTSLARRLARQYGVRGATIMAIHNDGPTQPKGAVFERLRRNAVLSEAVARRRRAGAAR